MNFSDNGKRDRVIAPEKSPRAYKRGRGRGYNQKKGVKRMAKITANKLKNDLMKQLQQRGMDKQTQYVSLVEDYIELWNVKNRLIDDIRERGVTVGWNNGPSQFGKKKNESVTELTKVNNQMLKILAELGLRGADIPIEEEEVKL